MDRAFTSVSCILVVSDHEPALLAQFNDALAASSESSELIVVANALRDDAMLALRQTVQLLPDCTCLVVNEAVDTDFARLLGLERALGNHVLLPTFEVGAIPLMPFAAAEFYKGYDVVVCRRVGQDVERPGWAGRAAYRFLGFLSGVSMPVDAYALCGLSREAALRIRGRPEAQLLLRAGGAGKGFPSSQLTCEPSPTRARHRENTFDHLRRAFRLIWSTGLAPVRLLSVVTLSASMLALLYSLYVVAVYLTVPDIQRGWTTLSLELSGLVFLLSLSLALLSEYVAQIYVATASLRVHHVVRVIRSPRSRRQDRLNVVDGEGRYMIGAPSLPRAASDGE